MNDPYGVLPFPKYDEAQTEYRSGARNTHNSFAMPITCKDPDRAGAVFEALSSANYVQVAPAYFEMALKTKYASDNDTARMYDIIRAGTNLDFAYIFNNPLGKPIQNVYEKGYKTEGVIASQIASNKDKIINTANAFFEAIEAAYSAQ